MSDELVLKQRTTEMRILRDDQHPVVFFQIVDPVSKMTCVINPDQVRELHSFLGKHIRKSCACENVEFGTYSNSVVLMYPFPTERYPVVGTKMVNVDRCIALEVIDLWNKGIETLESCCGHNNTTAYIAVPEQLRQRMIDEGYQADPEHPRVFFSKHIEQLKQKEQ